MTVEHVVVHEIWNLAISGYDPVDGGSLRLLLRWRYPLDYPPRKPWEPERDLRVVLVGPLTWATIRCFAAAAWWTLRHLDRVRVNDREWREQYRR